MLSPSCSVVVAETLRSNKSSPTGTILSPESWSGDKVTLVLPSVAMKVVPSPRFNVAPTGISPIVTVTVSLPSVSGVVAVMFNGTAPEISSPTDMVNVGTSATPVTSTLMFPVVALEITPPSIVVAETPMLKEPE